MRTHQVGIDAEWRPIRKKGQKERLAVVQLAWHGLREQDGLQVVVLDVPRLVAALERWGDDERRGGEAEASCTENLATDEDTFAAREQHRLAEAAVALFAVVGHVMASQQILKVGFDVRGDLKKMARAHTTIAAALRPVEALLDLSAWYTACKPGGARISLAGLVAEFLDAELNKDACLSNWEARPLSRQQLQYAALDASVLLPLWRRLHAALPVHFRDLLASFKA